MLRGRTIVVGVSGGIAAYKACELVRRLQARGATVVVVMTHAATEFVTPLTFQALTGNPVVTTLWGNQAPAMKLPAAATARTGGRVEHVDVAEAADALVIAPATADLMARMVHGEAPDALTSIVLAVRAPLIVCPSMDLEMWRAAATQENVRTLRARGATIVGPASGPLASGLVGPGRLAEVEDIVAAAEAAVVRRESMKGVRVLIGAGRTEEPIDPVRILTNRSSGRMGVALAEAAHARGADVTLVAGVMDVDPPVHVRTDRVRTAVEMQRGMVRHAKATDVVLMAAAVADFRVKRPAVAKIKREGGLALELTPNPDILAGLGETRRIARSGGLQSAGLPTLVGFALETSQDLARARAKLRDKGVDLIVLNTPAEGIGGDTNQVTLVEGRSQRKLPRMSKREVAEAVLDRVLELRRASGEGARGADPIRRRDARVGAGGASRRTPPRRMPEPPGGAERRPSGATPRAPRAKPGRSRR